MSVYKAVQKVKGVTPTRWEVVHEEHTETKLIQWLLENGGGIYRNILHNFNCPIKPSN